MTGYGRGVAAVADRTLVVELKAVNHRFVDLKLRGLPLDPAVEEKLTSVTKKRIKRGSVTAAVRVEGGSASATARPDLDAARRVYRELSELAMALHLDQPITLDVVIGQPGVMVPRDVGDDPDAFAAAVTDAASQALDALVAMRETEGASLQKDFHERLDRLGELANQLEAGARSAPVDAGKRLQERLARLLKDGNVAVDEQRLAQEVAILADRQDVTEELVRLRSHIEQFRKLMTSSDPVGRRLDFLVQELGREVNTIGSKSQAASLANLVVECKAELEKIREQVQNVE